MHSSDFKNLLQVWTNCNGMDKWQNSFTKKLVLKTGCKKTGGEVHGNKLGKESMKRGHLSAPLSKMNSFVSTVHSNRKIDQ